MSRSRWQAVRRVLAPAVAGLVVLAAWQAAVRWSSADPRVLPGPDAVAEAFVTQPGLFASNALVTAREILAGWAFGAAVGFVAGVALASSRLLRAAIEPWLVASQMVPVMAIAPILVLWFGFGPMPKIVVVALVSFFPVAVNTADGLLDTDPELVAVLRSMGAGRRRVATSVRLPSALPQVFTGLRLGMALAVVGAVFGEWVGGRAGLGTLMLQFNNQVRTADLFAAVAVLGVLGMALYGLVGLVERLALPWTHVGRPRR